MIYFLIKKRRWIFRKKNNFKNCVIVIEALQYITLKMGKKTYNSLLSFQLKENKTQCM